MGAHTRILAPHRRELVEAEIDRHLQRVSILIARLDRADGDCDLEDDDPAGGAADDIGEEGTLPEDDEGKVGMYAYGDDDHEGDHEDRRIRQRHVRRIQRTRCDEIVGRHGTTYRLLAAVAPLHQLPGAGS